MVQLFRNKLNSYQSTLICGLMSRHLSPGQKKVISILFCCDVESEELCISLARLVIVCSKISDHRYLCHILILDKNDMLLDFHSAKILETKTNTLLKNSFVNKLKLNSKEYEQRNGFMETQFLLFRFEKKVSV